ncbi:MAG TPA: hypothetical protein VGE74_10020 [Gemmata sp.]
MTTPDTSTRETCAIKGLVAFGPGWHKDELYTPQRCDQIVTNFRDTGGRPVPLAKIGHDRQQRYARSLGFPNVGVVTRCEPVGDGCFAVDITNVPVEVGAKVSAGLLRGASVELKSHQRDPRDPARELPGDVLTGISLLGEEQPCVSNWPEHLRARALPRATFPDGTRVPPNYELARWLDLAAEVSADIAAEQGGAFSADRRTVTIRGRRYPAPTLCFSAFDPVTPSTPPMTPEQRSALEAAGFTPEQMDAITAALGGTDPNTDPGTADHADTDADTDAPPAGPPGTKPGAKGAKPPADPTAAMAAACKRYAADPAATPEQKMMARMFAELQEVKKRTGELQASADAARRQNTESREAAMAAEVERDLRAVARKVEPRVIETVVRPTALGIFRSRAFASEADRRRTYSEYIKGFLALPDDPRLASAVPARGTAADAAGTTTAGRKVVAALKDVAPNVHKRLTGGN